MRLEHSGKGRKKEVSMYDIALVVGFERLVCEIRAQWKEQEEGGQYVQYSPGSWV